VAAWDKAMREAVSRRRHEFDRKLAVWMLRDASFDQSRPDAVAEVLRTFGDRELAVSPVSVHSWNGGNIRPPMMHFGEISTLGVMGTELGQPKVSFALDRKPFNDDPWFHTQQLVASLSFIGGLYGDEGHALAPPFIPELNEFYARTMHFEYNKLRSESGRIGLVIDADDTSSFIYALPVADLIERVLDLAGYSAELSDAGLIARQLIAQLGGVDGARVFKIPGVRRLLKTQGRPRRSRRRARCNLLGAKTRRIPAQSLKIMSACILNRAHTIPSWNLGRCLPIWWKKDCSVSVQS
jgi:hypothetical protein